MTTESLDRVHAEDEVLIRERENLALFLRHLSNELADHRCEIHGEEDRDFAYFEIKLDWDWNDIDIYVHAGKVAVRMARQK